jgi:hypothetical protein
MSNINWNNVNWNDWRNINLSDLTWEDYQNINWGDINWNDKEFMIQAIKIGFGWWMDRLIENHVLLNDDDVMTIGITKCGGLLHYASNRLKNNYDIVKEAVKNSWFNLRYASEELKNNKEIVTIAVAQDGCALEYASEELKNNKEFMLELLKINWDVILIIANHYFEDELREEYGCDSQKYGCNYYS